MNGEIINTKYWSYVPGFVLKNIRLISLGYTIVGYFPYHTAKIRQRLHRSYTVIPRKFLNDFEKILIEHNISDNKAVYICETNPNVVSEHCCWAIMLKDDWATISGWGEVVTYEGKPFKIKK